MSCLSALQTPAQTYPSQSIKLFARWDDTTITPNSYWVHSRYNSVVGWADPLNGHEYAIIGSQLGTHFIDIMDPAHPVQVDYVAGRRGDCLWREYKTYNHYLYMVSDDAAPNSFQVADLSYLPDSVHVVYDSDSLFVRAHTVFIDGDKLYAGIVHTLSESYSMAVYSLADPERPQFLRSLKQDYPFISIVHDMFVRNDTIYASCGLQGLHILKYNLNNSFTPLDSFATSPANYNHSSYLDNDSHTLYFCEEVPTGRPVVALNVSDPSNLEMINSFYSHQDATPHNPFIRDNLLFVAYYQDGLQVFDISDPLYVKKVGFFDTYPFNTNGYSDPAYQGAWGAYPFLPSGTILVSDMQSGLFILDADSLIRAGSPNNIPGITLNPNPAHENILIGFGSRPGIEFVKLEIMDVTGRILFSKNVQVSGMNEKETISISHLAKGIYLLRATSDTNVEFGTLKFIRQ